MSEDREADAVPIEELGRFQHYVHFVSLDPAKNRQRFYLLSWQVALTGDIALVCRWGRLGTQGRTRILFFPDRSTVVPKIERLIKRRLRRGYQVQEWE